MLMDVHVHGALPLIAAPVARHVTRTAVARHLLIRFTEAVHLSVSVNRLSTRCVKALGRLQPPSTELPLGSWQRRGERARRPRQLGWQRAGESLGGKRCRSNTSARRSVTWQRRQGCHLPLSRTPCGASRPP